MEGSEPIDGTLLTRFVTVNDLHFGETVCGLLEGVDAGPVLMADPGADPYPTVMNTAAVREMAELGPDAVVAKGDLTASGAASEFAEFEATYRAAFGDRLIVTLGNHDKPASGGQVPPVPPMQSTVLPGALLAVLDTARHGMAGGRLSREQLEWLDDVASAADRPVLVFGHHPAGGEDMTRLFGPGSGHATCLDPASTDGLVDVVLRRPRIVGYFAGHTHRNKVRRLGPTGRFPWVEVGCVKDFPGSWAEYRVFDQAVVQVHHRITADPLAFDWSERCRAMFGGHYPAYALGSESDRTFRILPRPAWDTVQ